MDGGGGREWMEGCEGREIKKEACRVTTCVYQAAGMHLSG